MNQPPMVSVILPTYNRIVFLPKVIASICNQTFKDWELIIIDDGSTDGTGEIINNLIADIQQQVKFIYQENQGPAIARNNGVSVAQGNFISFLDSDDEWLPHHLEDSVYALTNNPQIDWVYSATTMIDRFSKKIISNNCFYTKYGLPKKFLSLRSVNYGKYNLIIDPNVVSFAIENELYAGLQSSVIRKNVFEILCIPDFRIGEDQIFAIKALKLEFNLAWTEDVHVIYNIHPDSLTLGDNGSYKKKIQINYIFLKAFESLNVNGFLNSKEKKCLFRKLAKLNFWNIGYLYQSMGQYGDARASYLRGIMYTPMNMLFWKSYLLSYIKQVISFFNHNFFSINPKK